MSAAGIAVREVQVRPVRASEVPRWNALMREQHYLGFRKFCGRRLLHVAELDGRWLALVGWHAAALHCAARERWIGWTQLQRRARLFLVVNNSRFLVLAEAAGVRNLASRVLGLSLRRLPGDWLAQHGQPVLLAESFVDPSRFAGTCYHAANWLEVGATRGFGRVRGGTLDYVEHGAPKRVFLYPLRRDARQQLAAPRPHPAWIPWRPRMELNDKQLQSLWEHLRQVTDPRQAQGRRYPLPTVLAIVIAARLAGCETLTQISDFGRALSAARLRSIGARQRRSTGRYDAPGVSTLHYILKRLDEDLVEELMAAWMAEQVPGNEPLALDGKTLRGSYDRDLGADGQPHRQRPRQQLSAVGIHSACVVGQIGYSGNKDEAEGAALRQLARRFAGSGRCLVADALHTQTRTAQDILDLGLHYVFTVKANQPGLLEEIADGFDWDCLRAYSTVDGDHGRIEQRWLRLAPELDPEVPYIHFPGARFVAQVRRATVFKKDGRRRQPETVYLVTSLPPEQATPARLLALNRGYWGAVENGIHYVRDVALREDDCRVRKGALPRVMAAFANLAISILRLLRVKNIKRRMEQLHLRPDYTAGLVAC